MPNVSTEADLQACNLDPTADYTLVNDITLVTAWNLYLINNYSGTFDGQNYTISNVVLTGGSRGLFATVSSGTVQDLTVNAIINVAGATTVGGICHSAGNGSLITNCTTTGSITGNNSSSYCGGVVGRILAGGTVNYCSSSMTLTAVDNYSGGIIGSNASVNTILNCTFSGTITTAPNLNPFGIGGILGYSTGVNYNITSCSNTGSVTGYSATGGIFGYLLSGNVTITSCSNTGAIHTITTNSGGIVGVATGEIYFDACYNTGAITGAGDGVGGLIGTGKAGGNKCYNTGNVTGTAASTEDIGGLGGYINNASTVLSGAWTDCYCKDCTISTSDRFVGGLFGQVRDIGNLTRCYSTNVIVRSSSLTSGLIGYCLNYLNNWTLDNCWSDAVLQAYNDNNGGIIGAIAVDVSAMYINNCFFIGQIECRNTSISSTGGFIGTLYGDNCTFTNCYVDCEIGGLGYSAADRYVGGFIGDVNCNNCTFVNCYSKGVFICADVYVGGFIGRVTGATSSITNCYSESTVSGTSAIGGFIGWHTGTSATITDCYFNGTVSNNNGSCGGFIGVIGTTTSLTISKCYSVGEVLSTSASKSIVGGFAGNVASAIVIDNCYSNCDVCVSSGQALYRQGGGFVGTMDAAGTIKRCYCTGNVRISSIYNGGFIGWMTAGTIADCYSTGALSANNQASTGLFCGYFVGTGAITNCGCFQNSGGLNAIGNPAGNITYEKTDPTEWYDKSQGVYISGTNVWGFNTIWFAWVDDYPKFIAKALSGNIFFGFVF